ncbi:hypothetical protein AHAS_Ahas15G0229600 [Arachis hypogaea]
MVIVPIKGGGTMLKETTTIKDGTKATLLFITTTTTNLLPNTTTKTTITNHTNTHNKTKTTTMHTKRLTKDNKPINPLLLPPTKVMTLTVHSTKKERLRAMMEKHEENNRTLNAQVSTMSAQMSSIAEILSRLTLPPTNTTNTNQAASSSNLPSQPIPSPRG